MTIMPRQDKRAAVLTTTKEMDYLVVSRFDGSEAVSELFEYRIEALSTHENIDFDELLGKHMTLTLKSIGGAERHFDGLLTEAQWLGAREQFYVYRLVLRPWFSILSHRRDCFIFHNQTVQDIIKTVFGRHPFCSFDDRTGGAYPTIEYCVQYRESDMSFVCRLMEEFGISYFFEHENGAHKMVLVDNNSKYDPAPGDSRPYKPLAGQDRRLEECFNHWIPERRLTSGRVTVRDYNFKTPKAQMEANYSGVGAYEHSDQEIYDYPGRYEKQPDGKSIASYRLQSEEALDHRCMASGNCVTLYPGSTVTLTGHPAPGQDKEYVVLRAQHTFVSQSYRSGGTGGGEDSYDGQYELLGSDIPFRPLSVTQKPFVHGPQTALVVGADGEQIDCDEYGRILVRFYWDRKSDQSMRCRVAQSWASNKWGGMIVPRIGMEVVVEFLEGDPDRPLVTGSVYNKNNMPPNELPTYKTRSIFKSNSHKGEGYNEVRFEDEAGQEEIWIHAQKYLNTVVENDETRKIGSNRHTEIKASESLTIGGDNDIKIDGQSREEIQADYSLSVGANRMSEIAGGDFLKINMNQQVETGGSQHHKAGSSYYLQAGTSLVIESGMDITLKSSGGFITIGPSGIIIQGTTVLINSGGAPVPGTPVPAKKPKKYQGPHAKRYERSLKT